MGLLRISAALALLALSPLASAQEEPAATDAPPAGPEPTTDAEAEPTAPAEKGPLAKKLEGTWDVQMTGEFKRQFDIMTLGLKLMGDKMSKKEKKALDRELVAMELNEEEQQLLGGIAMVAALGTPEDLSEFRKGIQGLESAVMTVTADKLIFTVAGEGDEAAWEVVEETTDTLTIKTTEQSDDGPQEDTAVVRFPDDDTLVLIETKPDGEASMEFKRAL